MSGRYVVLPKADRDLDDQADYVTREHSLDLGLRFLAAAHETCALLASPPAMGWKCQLSHPALAETRVFRVRGFTNVLIFYRASRGRIEIVRVLHGSRDLERLFGQK